MHEDDAFDWPAALVVAVLLSPIWVPMLLILVFGLVGAVRLAVG